MKPGRKRIDILRVLRVLLQAAFFIFLPALFIDAYNGFKQLAVGLLHHSFDPVQQIPGLIAAMTILPATLLLGRFFCGWMCAFGALGDWIHLLFGRFVKWRISERLYSALKAVKYVLLAFLAVAGWALGVSVFASANPWDAFGMLFTVGKPIDLSFVWVNLTPALFLLAFILVGSVFVERFFCRYLCPMGALLAIVSKLRILRIVKPRAGCGKCRACTRSCSMGIPLYRMEHVSSAECIMCMQCVSACPRKNASLAIAGEDVRPAVAGLAAAAAMTAVYTVGDAVLSAASSFAATPPAQTLDLAAGAPAATESTETQALQTQEPSMPASQSQPTAGQTTTQPTAESSPTPALEPIAASQPARLYKDGTYQGTGRGFRNAKTKISVTIKDDRITELSTVSYGDDRSFFRQAYSAVSREILDTQSTDVDAVSGATYSSRGIMSAVMDALNKAKY